MKLLSVRSDTTISVFLRQLALEHLQTNKRISWARAEDSKALVPLIKALYRHDVPDAEEPSLSEVSAHISLLTDPATPHRLAIAWENENLAIGLAAVAIFVSVSDPRPDRWRQAELKELFVLPDFRGEGVGAVLLDWVEEHAIGSDACRLDWHVKSENERGISFYQSRGATVVSNRLSMRKCLSTGSLE